MATETENKLQSLIQMYQEGYRNPIIDQSIDKLVALEIAQAHSELQRLKARLTVSEQEYGMDSAAFYMQFRAGELGDEMAFVEWRIFWDLYQAKRLDELAPYAV